MSLVSCDYLFLGARGVDTQADWEPLAGEDRIQNIWSHCGKTKSLFVRAVPKKRGDENGYVAQSFVDDILWLGHSRVI